LIGLERNEVAPSANARSMATMSSRPVTTMIGRCRVSGPGTGALDDAEPVHDRHVEIDDCNIEALRFKRVHRHEPVFRLDCG
jgi:hypothetical protein